MNDEWLSAKIAECEEKERRAWIMLDRIEMRQIARRLLPQYAESKKERAMDKASTDELVLTPREVEIFRLIGQDRTNEEIASSLKINKRTVATYIYQIQSKLWDREEQHYDRSMLIEWAKKHYREETEIDNSNGD